MQAILGLVLMLVGFVSGIYVSDNNTIMDCIKDGKSRLNGNEITCEVIRLHVSEQSMKHNIQLMVEEATRRMAEKSQTPPVQIQTPPPVKPVEPPAHKLPEPQIPKGEPDTELNEKPVI